MNNLRFSYLNVIMVITLLVFCSCNQQKKKYIDEFENFVVQVEMNCDSFSIEDWELSDQQFDYFESLFPEYQEKMTQEEIEKVANIEMRYLNSKPKRVFNSIINNIQNSEWGEPLIQMIRGGSMFVDGLLDIGEKLGESNGFLNSIISKENEADYSNNYGDIN